MSTCGSDIVRNFGYGAPGDWHSSRIRFLRFFENPNNATFYVFLKCHVKKNVKNVESVVQVFTFSTLKWLTKTFTVKQLHTTYTCHVIHTTLY